MALVTVYKITERGRKKLDDDFFKKQGGIPYLILSQLSRVEYGSEKYLTDEIWKFFQTIEKGAKDPTFRTWIKNQIKRETEGVIYLFNYGHVSMYKEDLEE